MTSYVVFIAVTVKISNVRFSKVNKIEAAIKATS